MTSRGIHSRVGRVSAIGAAAACAAAVGAVPASASVAKLHFYGVENPVTATTPSGQPVHSAPKPGDRLDGSFRLFAGSAKHHAAKSTGSVRFACVVSNPTTQAACHAVIRLGASSLESSHFILHFTGRHVDGPITGGTGRFAGCAGKFTSADTNRAGDKVDFFFDVTG
jgi:hypothetical protein